MSFNLTAAKRNLKKKKKNFRLQETIQLAASDRYNDTYITDITARRIRDRYVITVEMVQGATQGRLFSNSWIYKDVASCWGKYEIIVDLVTDLRDFIESEGLKNVVFQYMVKHALSAIPSDVENIYETNNITARQVIDEATKGNIIKNFPTIPFLTQSGPDQLDQVYSAVGNAPNPVPSDNIKAESQLAPYQHQRNKIPISKFQEAAGINENMFKKAESSKQIKRSEPNLVAKQRSFIEKIKDNADKAKEFGKQQAMLHYMDMTGSDQNEAEAFYHGVKAVASQANVVLNVSASSLLVFLASDEYSPVFDTPDLIARYNQQAAKREQSERALGCYGLTPTYSSVTFLENGDTTYGKCALKLSDVQDDAVLICGDSFRARTPSRPDYVEDSSLILYPFSALEDCKAASIILAMSKADLAGGPAMSIANILDHHREFGRCEALIFKPLSMNNIGEIVTSSISSAKSIRKLLMRLGKMFPVTSSTEFGKIINSTSDREPKDEPAIKTAPQMHFCVGDRIATKPTSQQAKVLGTIIGMQDGQLTVDWDGGTRSIFDMTEALMRIMEAPKDTPCKQGMVVYSLPGMEEETVILLSMSGVDPVSLYGIASHHQPAAAAEYNSARLENLVKSLSAIGVSGQIIKGYVPSDSGEEDAFKPKEWVEAILKTGVRVIVDVMPEDIKIIAGDTDDYITPSSSPKIEIE